MSIHTLFGGRREKETDLLRGMIPVEGAVTDKDRPGLEEYRKFSNAYYRWYNDGDSFINKLRYMSKRFGLEPIGTEEELEMLGDLVIDAAIEEHTRLEEDERDEARYKQVKGILQQLIRLYETKRDEMLDYSEKYGVHRGLKAHGDELLIESHMADVCQRILNEVSVPTEVIDYRAVIGKWRKLLVRDLMGDNMRGNSTSLVANVFDHTQRAAWSRLVPTLEALERDLETNNE